MNNAKPVNVGDRFGCYEAMEAIANRTIKGKFRCVDCGDERSSLPMMLASRLKREQNQPVCVACRKRLKPKKTEEEKRQSLRKWTREWKSRQRAKEKELPKYRQATRGTQCDHDKELICVDPGGVEIRRCRLCDVVGEPAWTVTVVRPQMNRSMLAHHQYEDDPGFENAVRRLEDFELEPEEEFDRG